MYQIGVTDSCPTQVSERDTSAQGEVYFAKLQWTSLQGNHLRWFEGVVLSSEGTLTYIVKLRVTQIFLKSQKLMTREPDVRLLYSNVYENFLS